MITSNWKQYAVSSLITFVTGFAIVFVKDIDTLTLETLKDGAIVGLLFSACRAGFKAVLEFLIAKHTSLLSK